MIRKPWVHIPGSRYPYDSLVLESVVEFGMNESRDHLVDDIQRLNRAGTTVEKKFIVHLYRLSRDQKGRLASNRDWSPTSKRILNREDVSSALRGSDIDLYYAMYDGTGSRESGAWHMHSSTIDVL